MNRAIIILLLFVVLLAVLIFGVAKYESNAPVFVGNSTPDNAPVYEEAEKMKRVPGTWITTSQDGSTEETKTGQDGKIDSIKFGPGSTRPGNRTGDTLEWDEEDEVRGDHE